MGKTTEKFDRSPEESLDYQTVLLLQGFGWISGKGKGTPTVYEEVYVYRKYAIENADEIKRVIYNLMTRAIPDSPKRLELMLKCGAKIDPDLLVAAIGQEDLTTLKMFLDNGLDLTKNVGEKTPLQFACDDKKKSVFRCLVRRGAKLDSTISTNCRNWLN